MGGAFLSMRKCIHNTPYKRVNCLGKPVSRHNSFFFAKWHNSSLDGTTAFYGTTAFGDTTAFHGKTTAYGAYHTQKL